MILMTSILHKYVSFAAAAAAAGGVAFVRILKLR